MNFGFHFNSCSQFRKMTFPANFKGVLFHETCQGVRCCVSLVGGMTALKWGAKTVNILAAQKFGFFLRELPLLTRINKGCRFDGFSWKLARVFVRYKRSKELSLNARAFDFTKIKTLKNCVTSQSILKKLYMVSLKVARVGRFFRKVPCCVDITPWSSFLCIPSRWHALRDCLNQHWNWQLLKSHIEWRQDHLRS